MTELRDRAVALYDAFTHDHHDRRTLLKQMTALAGSVAAAEAPHGSEAEVREEVVREHRRWTRNRCSIDSPSAYR